MGKQSEGSHVSGVWGRRERGAGLFVVRGTSTGGQVYCGIERHGEQVRDGGDVPWCRGACGGVEEGDGRAVVALVARSAMEEPEKG